MGRNGCFCTRLFPLKNWKKVFMEDIVKTSQKVSFKRPAWDSNPCPWDWMSHTLPTELTGCLLSSRLKIKIKKIENTLIKGTLSRWQVRILSSKWYHNDRTFFQLHYTGIVIFIKTGPVFVGFRCCKMCFWNLKFLKGCSRQCPFKWETYNQSWYKNIIMH